MLNEEYSTKKKACDEQYSLKIRYIVVDILDIYCSQYRFIHGDILRTIVLDQLNRLLRHLDFDHVAFKQLECEGLIDWFAEPFFKGKKIKLSELCQEYDSFCSGNRSMVSQELLNYMHVDNFKRERDTSDVLPE